ncbi:MAG: hypothetical protein JWM91_962 [Rhodospirillales bacterium]|nr:hypothetical protein [Rhodospirillales bacterium]
MNKVIAYLIDTYCEGGVWVSGVGNDVALILW